MLMLNEWMCMIVLVMVLIYLSVSVCECRLYPVDMTRVNEYGQTFDERDRKRR